MKISLITVVYNGEAFLEKCIQSVLKQDFQDIEYIIVDGASTDGTSKIIENYQLNIDHLISEKDHGLYDAINKGIALATGDVIGLLNADDELSSGDVLSLVAKTFSQDDGLEGVYGDLNYIHPVTQKVIREWRSRPANFEDIEKGWMPAHPTLYLRKQLFEKYGNYALDLGTAADYDLILRFFHSYKIKTVYLRKLMVNMRTGGVSNQSMKSRIDAFKNDYLALKRNKIPWALPVLICKKLVKLAQFMSFLS